MSEEIIVFGNEILRKEAEEIEVFDDDLLQTVERMFEIMYQSKGIGLAAPQIALSKRLLVYDTGDDKGVLINPIIKNKSSKTSVYEEGCLSVPGISEEVIRPARVVVEGFTPDKKEIKIEAKGLLATVLQHEIDHLNGVLFFDHLEDHLKKELRPQLKKIKRLSKKK